MKNKKIIIFNIIIFFMIILIRHFSFQDIVLKYINFETKNCDFKDLLSISATILAVFLGFIATAVTVLISMCDKRIMMIVKKLHKLNIVLESIKKSLKYGIICLACIGIIFVNLDFNLLSLRLILIWIILNSLFIFSYESRFLIYLVRDIMIQTFLGNEEITVQVKPKANLTNKKEIKKK